MHFASVALVSLAACSLDTHVVGGGPGMDGGPMPRVDGGPRPDVPTPMLDGGGDAGPPASGPLRSLSVGGQRSCIVDSVGGLFCWGRNPLGDGTNSPSSTAVRIGSERAWSSVSTGADHTCAVAADGALYCWGPNDFGEVGTSVGDPSLSPRLVPELSGVVAVSAGADHTCALTSGGAFCFGNDTNAQLGRGAPGDATAAPVPLTLPIISISAGTGFTCAVHIDTTIYCWGSNNEDMTGTGTMATITATPTAVTAPGHSLVDAGHHDTLALLGAGTLFGWGRNQHGCLATGDTDRHYTEVPAATSLLFITVSIGRQHACGIVGADVWCWGTNASRRLGTDGASALVPTVVPSFGAATLVSAGLDHSCAALVDGSVYCWGANNVGQLGLGAATASELPTLVPLR